jgi:hypothetical protein
MVILFAEAWFCSKECMEILSKLSTAVNSGFMLLGEKYCMQLLHGLNHLPAIESSLVEAAEILQESFDPIMDKANNQDLIPAMVHSEGLGSEWDFHGVFTVLLFHEVRLGKHSSCIDLLPCMEAIDNRIKLGKPVLHTCREAEILRSSCIPLVVSLTF